MWFYVTLLLFVDVAVATSCLGSVHQHAWEKENEYQYLVRGRTLAGVNKLKQQYTGIQTKGTLLLRGITPELLEAKLSNPQYAQIHSTLPNGLESEISEQMLEYRDIPMSGKPFQIKLKHGLIRDVMVDRNVPTWELNMLKGILNTLQIDTQGENAIYSRSMEFPQNEPSSVMFRAMEDSVSGDCEVLYDITPLPQEWERKMLDKIPYPELRGDGNHYDVKKMKNYEKCVERQVYHHGFDPWAKEKTKKQSEVPSQLSTTNMIISGNLTCFTIQSGVMKHEIFVKPEKPNSYLGTVHSVMRLTLLKKIEVANSPPWISADKLINLESTGNLVYTLNSPFSEHRRVRLPGISRNSEQEKSSEVLTHHSDSSDSSSSEENNESLVLQSKLSLQNTFMTPNVPLLPYFIGYKGKAVSNKIDIVERAQNLITQIADEIQDSFKENEGTLEKFIILKNLIRTMNQKQCTKLEQRVLGVNRDGTNEQRYNNAWCVLRDSIAQAGTGPASTTIESWLKSGQLRGIEAAQVLNQIPKTVQQPSTDYLKKLFEVITNPIVTEQEHLNVSAPMSFAQLLRNSYIGQKPYRKHCFGPTFSNGTQEIQNYIRYLTNELKQGYAENNNKKIQTYILALGSTAHPLVISAFEPYLEGTQSATKYQRTLMVASLTDLVRYLPKLVGPILFKLYLNEREGHEIRCMAIQQFILTDPPLIMLQRIAKFTNYDKSEQVNSAVKSTLDSVIKAKKPEWQNLANKARSVRYLVTPKQYGMWESKGYYLPLQDKLIKGLSVQTIGSADTLIPKYVRLDINTILDFLGQPTLELEKAVSSYRQEFNEVTKIWNSEAQDGKRSEELLQKSLFGNLAQTLELKPEQQENLEGNILINTLYNSVFWPYDCQDLQKTILAFKEFLFKNDYKLETTVFNNYERTMSFPNENGLPFVYTYEAPMVVKVELDLKNENPTESVIGKSGKLNILVANKVLERFGFVALFEHQNYIAGMDEYGMLRVPLKGESNIDLNQRSLRIKFQLSAPQERASEYKLLHYSNVPFTTRQDILDLQPASLERNTHPIITSKKQTTTEQGEISIKMEYDNERPEKFEEHEGYVAMFWKLQKYNNNKFKKIHIAMTPELIEKSNVLVTAEYNEKIVGNKGLQADELKFPPVTWKPNSQDRRNEFLNGLSKGLMSGKVRVVDVSCGFPKYERQYVLTLGWVNSNLDRKGKAYVYYNSHLPKQEKLKQEICYAQEIRYSGNTPFSIEHVLNNKPKDQLKATLRYGETCQTGEKLTFTLNRTRSDHLNNLLRRSTLTKQCQEDSRNGDKVSRTCQTVNNIAQIRDQTELSTSSSNKIVKRIAVGILDFLQQVIDVIRVKLTPIEKDTEIKDITVKVIASPVDVLKVNMYTPEMNLSYPHSWESTAESKWLQNKADVIFQSKIGKPICTLGNDFVFTFDNSFYNTKLGKCKHVLFIKNVAALRSPIPRSSRVVILAEDADNDSRNVYVVLGNQEVKMMKWVNHPSTLVATINGEKVEVSKDESYLQYNKNDETLFEVEILNDGTMKLTSDEYGITVMYDGRFAEVLASDKYRDTVRGLCGNYDSNSENDFITPKNCILSEPELFTATYALTEENCQGLAIENKQKAEQARCLDLSEIHWQRNVISDREAGRMQTESENWGYHGNRKQRINWMKERGQNRYNNQRSQEQKGGSYDNNQDRSEQKNIMYRTRMLEEAGEICFTNQPIPTCREGTTPMGRYPARYELHCQENNEESQQMKRRIEQGANPDFTRKSVNRSHTFQVPESCIAS